MFVMAPRARKPAPSLCLEVTPSRANGSFLTVSADPIVNFLKFPLNTVVLCLLSGAGKAPNKKKVTNDKENCIVDVVVIEETSKSNKKKTVPNKPTEEELLQKKKARNAFRRQKRYRKYFTFVQVLIRSSVRKIEKQTKGEVDTVENVIEVK